MANYVQCGPEVGNIVQTLLEENYPGLMRVGVTFDLLFAYSAKVGAPAVKVHGWPAAAMVRIVPVKDRVSGLSDVQIIIDGDRWPTRTAEEKKALIDHELYHIAIVQDKDSGRPKLDDCGRPKLKLRHHDWELSGFWEIIERHGLDAIEAKEFAHQHQKFVQDKFQFWG